MAKIRHIALATKDPEKVANFYKAAFGAEEHHRHERNCFREEPWHAGSSSTARRICSRLKAGASCPAGPEM